MGGGGNKEKKAGLQEQAGKQSNLGDLTGGWGVEDRARNTGLGDRAASEYYSMLDGIGRSAGGNYNGPSPGAAAAAIKANPTMEWWKTRMGGEGEDFDNLRTGGGVFSEAAGRYGLGGEGRYNDVLRQLAGNQAGMYQGLNRQLARSGAIRGGAGAGMGEQALALASQGARSQTDALREGRIGMENQISGERLAGGEGLQRGAGQALAVTGEAAGKYGGLWGKHQQQKRAAANRARSAQSRAAAMADPNSPENMRMRLGITREMRGLRGEAGSELAYTGQAGQHHGAAAGSHASMPTETPWWEKALGAGTAAAGAFL